ncbi:MAG: ActS/PrrB/RegB family redox-sensitive histidine kinase [Rhodobacterales bacterium]|nr:ActS/PrrB/RegB family redox-sensitive histidine kinase [Rhodobacterales bacterium]
MTKTDLGLFRTRQRGSWIRLRMIILLRWGAIFGQVAALVVAQQIFHLQLEFGLCYLVVGVSAIGNLVANIIFPESKRLSEFENLLMVLFDLVQLGLLLFLTGGLNNPFSVLIVGPVIVSAAALSLRSTIFLGSVAIMMVSVLAIFHLPLRTDQGYILQIPQIFIFGNWVAISIAVLFLGVYSRWITTEMHSMSDALQATQMALNREQKLTDLGGVVAAAAHEFGTPLATIKIASTELINDLEGHPELQEDARLIREQTDRCRNILREMGQAGKDDLFLHKAPLTTVVRDAAEPHLGRGINVIFEDCPNLDCTERPPYILRLPEVIHGLRNLIQNAVDFATETVWIESSWSKDVVSIRVMDDGPGFPPQLIGRIGDPFMPSRRANRELTQRPEYEGMGLGLFIAKTLLERTGAELDFANGSDDHSRDRDHFERRGAIIEIAWPRRKIDAIKGDFAVPVGENKPLKF